MTWADVFTAPGTPQIALATPVFAVAAGLLKTAFGKWYSEAGALEDRFKDDILLATSKVRGEVRSALADQGLKMHLLLQGDGSSDIDEDAAAEAIGLYNEVDRLFAALKEVWMCERILRYMRELCTRLFVYYLAMGIVFVLLTLVLIVLKNPWNFVALFGTIILASPWLFWLLRNTKRLYDRTRSLETKLGTTLGRDPAT